METPTVPLPPATLAVERCPACDGTNHAPWRRVPGQMLPPGAPSYGFSRCGDCGLVFLNPRVPPEALGPFYGDDYLPYRGPEAWGRWAPLVRQGMAGMDRRRVARVLRHVEVGAGASVLDVGCGQPTFLAALRRATGVRAVGVDFSDRGWRGDPARWQGLELHRGELGGAALEGPFRVVTMWHYLEHDYDPAGTLRRVRELADGATHLFIEVPDHDAWTRRRQGVHWAGYHAPRHTALYHPASLRVLLERAGWQVVTVDRWGTLDPWALWWLGRRQREGMDWSESMERRFPAFLLGKAATWPVAALQRWMPLGVMTAVARPT